MIKAARGLRRVFSSSCITTAFLWKRLPALVAAAAAVPYFALKRLAGYSKVKLSIESQMGWLQDERGLPLWTYSAPAMTRDAEWLPSWGGRMMRTYGVSRLSVIDVRPAEAYAQGHVPYAVNVSADAFRAHAKDPRKLADLLVPPASIPRTRPSSFPAAD